MITYEGSVCQGGIKVRLDGRVVGRIVSANIEMQPAFRYKPTRGDRGEAFDTVAEVKRSLEG